jgi:hypothetical protein
LSLCIIDTQNPQMHEKNEKTKEYIVYAQINDTTCKMQIYKGPTWPLLISLLERAQNDFKAYGEIVGFKYQDKIITEQTVLNDVLKNEPVIVLQVQQRKPAFGSLLMDAIVEFDGKNKEPVIKAIKYLLEMGINSNPNQFLTQTVGELKMGHVDAGNRINQRKSAARNCHALVKAWRHTPRTQSIGDLACR